MDRDEFIKIMASLALGLKKWAPDFKDQATLNIWFSFFRNAQPEKLKMACRMALQTLDEFPSMAKLTRMMNNEGSTLSDEEVGNDISGRILGAISKYGWPNPNEAKEFIGDLGWEVVKDLGGWEIVCNVTTDGLPSAKKQWRDLATIKSKRLNQFGIDKAPGLPDKQANQGIVGATISSIKISKMPGS